VVGVSTEVRQLGLDDEHGSFEWFVPMRTMPGAPPARFNASAVIVEHRTLVARATHEVQAIEAIKQAVHRIDPDVVLWTAGTVESSFARAVAQPRLVLIVLGVLGGLGLLLAAAGLYGVLSFLVTQRMREIGVRLALGARPESVFRLILRQGMILTALGILAGVVVATWLVEVMRALLFEVEPSDPLALIVVAGILTSAAVLACWHPAVRAKRVDPLSLLRE
jgi:putative ABC transport system permease protein